MSMKRCFILLSIMMALALALAQPAPAFDKYKKGVGGGYIEDSMCDGEPKTSFGFKVMEDISKGECKGEFQLSDVTCPNTDECFDIHVKEIHQIFVPASQHYVYFRGPTVDGYYVRVWAFDNPAGNQIWIDVATDSTFSNIICDYREPVLGDISVIAK